MCKDNVLTVVKKKRKNLNQDKFITINLNITTFICKKKKTIKICDCKGHFQLTEITLNTTGYNVTKYPSFSK